MLGKGAASDENALGQAAAEGDEEAFAAIFERHLPAVFATAWRVLNDRGAAAEVTYETFAAAWVYREGFRAEGWARSLLESTHHRAEAWLVANPAAVPQAARQGDATPPPNLGPMLRNRIVSALAAQGVPTDRDELSAGGSEGRHLAGPSRRFGRRDRSGGGGRAGALGALLAGSRARLAVGAAAATVVVVGAVGIGFLTTRESGASDGEVETGPPRPEDPPEGTTVTTARRRPTKAPTTTEPSTTTTSSTTTTTEPEATTSTTVAPTTTQAPSTTTTTTRPPSPAPRIVNFSGDFYTYNGDRCRSPDELLSIRWTTENATTGRIRREGSDWYPLRQLPSGGFDICTRLGTRWYLEVSNSVGTDDASFVQYEMTRR